MINQQYFFYMIAILVVSVIVFFNPSRVFCWYFKINKRISILEDILHELKMTSNLSEDTKSYENNSNSNELQTVINRENISKCSKCNKELTAEIIDGKIKNGYIACSNCHHIMNNDEYFENIKQN